VLFERGAQLIGIDRLRHLRQCDEDLALGVINILEVLVKQIFQGLALTGYGLLLLV
jgi:hypothetical protein